MIRFEAAALTDVGLEREINEDSAWAQVRYFTGADPFGLFIVCDGMGGHMGGEFASYWAIEAIKKEFSDLLSLEDPRDTVVLSKRATRREGLRPQTPQVLLKEIDLESRVRVAVQKANQVVYDYAKHRPDRAENAGTTLSMVVALGRQTIIANVGDSRTYLLRHHRLRQITRDHSLVAQLVESGQILPDDIYVHPQRNVIYRFLGAQGLVQVDTFQERLHSGDYLLLCSDGLWEMVRSEKKMALLIETAESVEQACQLLIRAANAAGGEDNIGVVLVRVS